MSKISDEVIDAAEEFLGYVDRRMEMPVAIGAKQFGVKEATCDSCTEPACCHQSLFVFLYEVLPLASHLRTTEQDTPELREKLLDAAIEMEGVPREEWLERYQPCVFLKNKRCTIYPYRPVRCRDYFVFTPQEDCAPPSQKGIAMADNRQVGIEGFGTQRQAMQALGVKETSMRIIVNSFPRVLLIALEGMDDGVDFAKYVRAQAWPTEEQLEGWIDGDIPEQKLVQLRKRKGA